MIVTATKINETVLNVPAAVTVISSRELDSLHLESPTNAIMLVPTAFISGNNAGTSNDFNIRGVGTPTLFAESGVALYYDGIDANQFLSYPTHIYDMSSIDVLRGPQGGLYGRDAIGGAVDLVPNMPTNDFEASTRMRYASNDREEVLGVLNLPLNSSGSTAVRFVGWQTNQSKGDYYNSYLHEYMDKNNSLGGRVTFRTQLTDDLTLSLLAEDARGNDPGTDLYFVPEESQTTISRDTEPRNHWDSTFFIGHLTWNTPFGQFVLLGGHRGYNLQGIEDTDLSSDFAPSANNGSTGQQVLNRANEVHSDSAEARWLSPNLGPVSILAGIDYLNASAVGYTLDHFNYFTTITTPLGLGPALLDLDNRQGVVSWSPFAQATWKITPAVSLIGDLRYTDDRKTENFLYDPSAGLTGLLPFFMSPTGLVTSRSFTNVSPGVTLAWSPARNWRTYAKVQTGFRAGGYNVNVGSLKDLPYNPETVINYEVGVKNNFSHGNGYWALAAYMMRENHQLAGQFDLTVPPTLGSYISNTGTARTYGIEPEIAYRNLLPGLDVSANIGWLDATYLSGTTAFTGSIAHKDVPYARPLTAAITLSYHHRMADGIDGLLTGSYTHRAAGWGDIANTVSFEAVDLLNLSAGIQVNQRYEISVYTKNALDDRYNIAFGGYRACCSYGTEVAEGRVVGVQLDVKYFGRRPD